MSPATSLARHWCVQAQFDFSVAVRFIVRIREPGKTFDVPIADFFTVRDGLIVSDDGVFDVHGRPCSP